VPTATIAQQNAFGAPGKYYFYPAIQTDIGRNAFVAFYRSGSNEYVNVRQTGRRVTDTANDLQGSVLVKAGESAYPLDPRQCRGALVRTVRLAVGCLRLGAKEP